MRVCLQLINILTLGSPDGKGCFFPDGLLGAIHLPTGYASAATGLEAWPAKAKLATQVTAEWLNL